MADIKYYDVILKPIITEKSMNGMAEKKYAFSVNPEATKTQITDGKVKRRGVTYGRTAKTKKAYVKLSEDSKDIEIFQGL